MVVSAISAISNLAADKHMHLHLIYRDISKNSLEMLEQFFDEKFNVKFSYYSIPKNLTKIFNNKHCPEAHISNAMFDRLFIHEIITGIDKTLYLDADTVVIGDLSKLYEINLHANYIGAVVEPAFEYDIKQVGYNAIRLMKIDINTHYFNSGILLMNLNKLRKINFIKKCKKYFNKNQKEIIWPDQDILNGILGSHTYFIPPKFNAEIYEGRVMSIDYHDYFDFYGKTLPYSEQEIHEAINFPAILHFVGSNKPWIHPGKYSLCKEKYWKYYNLSPWGNNDSFLIEKKLTAMAAPRENTEKNTPISITNFYDKRPDACSTLQ